MSDATPAAVLPAAPSLVEARRLLRDRAVLVVGAGGFIGTRLCASLLRDCSARVAALVPHAWRSGPLREMGATVVAGRLGDRRALERALRGVEIVFNLGHDYRAAVEASVRDFQVLITACAQLGVRRLVQASSVAVYDDWPGDRDLDESSPASLTGSPYKRIKRQIELELAECSASGGLETIALQPTLVLGAGSWQWTEAIATELLAGPVALPAGADGVCNYVDVEDVVDAFVLAARRGASGGCYIISGEATATWRELFAAHAALLGRGELRLLDPSELEARAAEAAPGGGERALLAWLARRVGDAALRELKRRLSRWRRGGGRVQFPSRARLELYRAHGRCSIERARRDLGYAPRRDLAASLASAAPGLRDRFGSGLS